jgi:hypothetical protein
VSVHGSVVISFTNAPCLKLIACTPGDPSVVPESANVGEVCSISNVITNRNIFLEVLALIDLLI